MRRSHVLLIASIMCWAVPAAEAQLPSPLVNFSWDVNRGCAGHSDQAAFGSAVAGGDFNGDGYSDIVVSAPVFDVSSQDEGRVYAYHGSACGLPPNYGGYGCGLEDWAEDGDQNGGRFGASVANAGDVNNDGYDDLIVGATMYDNGQTDEGRAYLYLGSPSGLTAAPAWIAEIDRASARFGTVAGAGDVNGDGYDDVIVGAPGYDNGEANEGCAYLYLGSASGLPASPDWTAESNDAGAQFGAAVAGAGDVNGDGYDDVIVGAPWYDSGEIDEGRVFVYLGSAAGLSASPDWTAESDHSGAGFGGAAACAGDVNGDGFSDVVVGAQYFANGEASEGCAYLYLGSAGGLSLTPVWTAEGDHESLYFGYSVAGVGDIDGNGLSDVVIGCQGYYGQNSYGSTHFFLGTPSGLSSTADWIGSMPPGSYRGPASVTGAGDIEADGHDDVLIGTGRGWWANGKAFIYTHASAVGSVSGVVLGDGVPLPGVTIDIYGVAGQGWTWTSTDNDGNYEFADLPTGQYRVTLVVPLGYRAVSPVGRAELTVCRGQSTTLDFVFEQVVAGDVRSFGYWKHQVNVYWQQRGHAQESFSAMTYTYPNLILRHFCENDLNPIWIEGVTCIHPNLPMQLDLESMVNTLNGHNDVGQVGLGNKWSQAAQQFLAVLLNVVSNRLPQGQVVSDDGATASQAIQDIAAMLLDADEANDELAKDIADAMNQGKMLTAGVVDLSRPTIHYARPMPSALAVTGPVRVAPNPMASVGTLDFEMPTAGRAEVRIFDPSGRMVRTLLSDNLEQGRHRVTWDGMDESLSPVASGVYFFRIVMPDQKITSRVVVMGSD